MQIKIKVLNFETLKPIAINMGIILIFTVIFVMVTNIVEKKKKRC